MKVGIIGAGNIGGTLALLLISKNIVSEISLIDIKDGLAEGRALDLKTLSVILNRDILVKGSNEYSIIKDFDIVVITAGITRKVGQSRDDLLSINTNIVGDAAKLIAKFAPHSTIIIVTNPLDTLTFHAYKMSGFKSVKVIGMAGELDSARAKIALASLSQISPLKANAFVLGTHDENMTVTPNFVANETKNAGTKITKLTGTSAYFAPAGAVYKMIYALKYGGEIICSVIDEENNIAYGRRAELGEYKILNVKNS
ncbi:MAG: hypothetical protein GXZ15_05835 [Campylobacter sp.]|nr:hypothetical protein [Campylobacter sp.]